MGNDISTALRPAFVMTILFALLVGIAYPLALTGIGQTIFPSQANGSLISQGGKVIGSSVIGQAFTSDRYFKTRPSAAGKGYDGLASSGSNYGPTSQALADRVRADVAAAKHSAPGMNVPADLVTTSASGLDPDLSPEAAFYQVDRVAKTRHVDPAMLRQLIDDQAGARFKTWQMPVSQQNGPQLAFAQTIAIMPFATVGDYNNYLARLRAVPMVFAQVQDSMRAGADSGRTLPQPLAQKAQAQVAALAAAKPEDGPFAAPLKSFPAGISAAEQKRKRGLQLAVRGPSCAPGPAA